MYGDPAAIRALAREAEELAAEARHEATRVRATAEVEWVSTGAERYRGWLEDQGRRIDRAAEELEQAAEHLHRHASEVQQRLDDIAAAKRWFDNAVSGAVSRAWRVAQDLGEDYVEPAIATLARNAPRPGSMGWLDFARRAGR